MTLTILLHDKNVSLELSDNGKVTHRTEWADSAKLTEELLQKIDIFLKESGVPLADIAHVEAESDLPDQYTAGRIVKTVARTLEFSLSGKNMPQKGDI